MSDLEKGELAQFTQWIRESLEALTTQVQSLQELVTQLRIAVGRKDNGDSALRDQLKEQSLEINNLRTKLDDLDKEYVTLKEFELVRRIVYGTVGLIVMSFMAAVVGLVMKGR